MEPNTCLLSETEMPAHAVAYPPSTSLYCSIASGSAIWIEALEQHDKVSMMCFIGLYCDEDRFSNGSTIKKSHEQVSVFRLWLTMTAYDQKPLHGADSGFLVKIW